MTAVLYSVLTILRGISWGNQGGCSPGAILTGAPCVSVEAGSAPPQWRTQVFSLEAVHQKFYSAHLLDQLKPEKDLLKPASQQNVVVFSWEAGLWWFQCASPGSRERCAEVHLQAVAARAQTPHPLPGSGSG